MMVKRIGLLVFVVALMLFAPVLHGYAADAPPPYIAQLDQILKANPPKPGEAVQMINLTQDDTLNILIVNIAEGATVKKHFHKTHDETYYVARGTGQLFIDGKWVDLAPGSIHFNPMGKVHSTKNTGKEPLVLISIFTPAMKEVDRNFVE